MENKMTPKEALEEIGRLEVCFDGIVCSINGCAKTRGNYDLVNQALTEHEKSKQVLEIIKDLFIFDFAFRFPTNQPMLRIVNKRTGEYWEMPINQNEFNLLKEWLK